MTNHPSSELIPRDRNPERPGHSRRQHIGRAALAIVFASAFIPWSISSMKLADRPALLADSTRDWLVSKAAVDGVDPYQSAHRLAEIYDIPPVSIDGIEDEDQIHGRLPGSLLLMTPITKTDYKTVFLWYSVVNGVSAIALLAAISFATRVRLPLIMLSAPLLVLTHPFLSAIEFGTQSMLVAVLVTTGVGLTARSDSRLGGLALGLAITLKLWPALLLLTLILRKRAKAAAYAIGISVALNAAGALVFSLTPSQIARGLSDAGSSWATFDSNVSVVGLLGKTGLPNVLSIVVTAAFAGAVLTLLLHPRIDTALSLWGTVMLGVVASPLSWDHYDLALIAVAVALAARTTRVSVASRIPLIAWATFLIAARTVPVWVGSGMAQIAQVTFAERVLLLVVLIKIAWETIASQPLDAPSVQETPRSAYLA